MNVLEKDNFLLSMCKKRKTSKILIKQKAERGRGMFFLAAYFDHYIISIDTRETLSFL